MRKTVLLYGLLGGVLIATLKLAEYRFLVLEHSLELYGGLVAVLFAVLGVWLGQDLTWTRKAARQLHVPVHRQFSRREGSAMRKFVLTFGLISGVLFSAMMAITRPMQYRVGFDNGMPIGYSTTVLAFMLIDAGFTFLEPLPVALAVSPMSAGVLSRRRGAPERATAAA